MESSKAYHTKCTGAALNTVLAHAGDNKALTLFGSCFCPFVQRVWIALEFAGWDYEYYEVDPYAKPADLLEVSPRGLVPALKLNNFNPPRAIAESAVILESIEEWGYGGFIGSGPPTPCKHLLPSPDSPYLRSVARFQGDHVNRNVVPAFYRYLQCQAPLNSVEMKEKEKAFTDSLLKLSEMIQSSDIAAADRSDKDLTSSMPILEVEGRGLLAGGKDLGWVDVMVAPWLVRAYTVLKHYRNWTPPTDRFFERWSEAVINHPVVLSTTSDLQLYLDSYKRYADNVEGTSQVAKAINAGMPLP